MVHITGNLSLSPSICLLRSLNGPIMTYYGIQSSASLTNTSHPISIVKGMKNIIQSSLMRSCDSITNRILVPCRLLIPTIGIYPRAKSYDSCCSDIGTYTMRCYIADTLLAGWEYGKKREEASCVVYWPKWGMCAIFFYFWRKLTFLKLLNPTMQSGMVTHGHGAQTSIT